MPSVGQKALSAGAVRGLGCRPVFDRNGNPIPMMNVSLTLPRRAVALVAAVLVGLMAHTPTLAADDAAPATELPALPLSASFGKGTPGENGGPYALTVVNTSDHTLMLEGLIIWSVQSHNRAQTLKLGPHELAAGESWTINDLAVEDRVVLEAEGYAKWEKKTPPSES